jgi:uncharacterized protein YuzB (UPF0349 family)
MAETIEYCLRNVDDETRERLRPGACTPVAADAAAGTDSEADAEIVERRCLQRCGDCYRSDFLVVDGTLETADSHASLLADYGVSTPEDATGREASDR